MSILSFAFVAFTATVLALYHLFSRTWGASAFRPQNWLLLVASGVFCASWDVRFLGILVIATFFNYGFGIWIGSLSHPSKTRAVLLGVVLNVSLLGVGRYVGLFNLPGTGVILVPVGISYYTFQAISYLVDVSRERIAPIRRWDSFALYMAYFAKLIAGPIERAKDFVPVLEQPRTLTSEDVLRAVWLIV